MTKEEFKTHLFLLGFHLEDPNTIFWDTHINNNINVVISKKSDICDLYINSVSKNENSREDSFEKILSFIMVGLKQRENE